MRPMLRILVAFALTACGSRPAVTPPPPSPRAVVTAPFTKPLSFSLLEDYDKGENLEGIANDFRLMHELGIDTWRGSFGWDDYEPEPGVYDFEWLHRFAEVAERERIKLRPYVGYTPEWAAIGRSSDEAHWNDPPAELSRWTTFIGALAGEMQRHENLLSYEIYNEVNSRLWWDGTPTEYAYVLAGAATAVRAADPDAQVLLGGLVWPDSDFMQQLCGEFGGLMFDIAPFHAYPGTWTPDTVTVETYLDAEYYDHYLPAVDSLCGTKPIWVNELGFATVGGRTERDQANWWAKAIATFAADRRIEHLGIYEIRDLPAGSPVIGDDPNHHLGLVDVNGSRKLAFSTVQLLVALLSTGRITVADSELEVELSGRHEEELYYHLFVRPDDRQVLIVWDNAAEPRLDFVLPRGGSAAYSYDLDGYATPHEYFEDGRLGRVYLEEGEVRIFVIEP